MDEFQTRAFRLGPGKHLRLGRSVHATVFPRDVPRERSILVGKQEGRLRFRDNQEVRDFLPAQMMQPDFRRRAEAGQIHDAIGLLIEKTLLVQVNLDGQPLVARRGDRNIRQAVAVDVAKRGAIGRLAPGDDLVVRIRESKRRIRMSRRHVAPPRRLGGADAGADKFIRFAVAVAGDDVVGLERVEFPKACQHVGRPEVGAALPAERSAAHDQVARADVAPAAHLEEHPH